MRALDCLCEWWKPSGGSLLEKLRGRPERRGREERTRSSRTRRRDEADRSAATTFPSRCPVITSAPTMMNINRPKRRGRKGFRDLFRAFLTWLTYLWEKVRCLSASSCDGTAYSLTHFLPSLCRHVSRSVPSCARPPRPSLPHCYDVDPPSTVHGDGTDRALAALGKV